MPLQTLYWHQPQSHLIDSWEFQFQNVGSEGWEWVYRVEPVDDCEECFQAVVELPATAQFVRSRAVGEEGVSPWSTHLPVYAPEPLARRVAHRWRVVACMGGTQVTELERGKLKRIHVNQHVIRANQKTGARDEVFTVKCGGKTYRGNAVEIDGPAETIYRPDRPLSCGARCWVETRSALTIRD